MFRSRIERLEKTLGVQHSPPASATGGALPQINTHEDLGDTLLTKDLRGSIQNTHNFEDTDYDQHTVGNVGGILQTSNPTMEDEDFID